MASARKAPSPSGTESQIREIRQCKPRFAGVKTILSEPFGAVVAARNRGGSGMNKVATVSWWSVAVLIAIVVVALMLAGR